MITKNEIKQEIYQEIKEENLNKQDIKKAIINYKKYLNSFTDINIAKITIEALQEIYKELK